MRNSNRSRSCPWKVSTEAEISDEIGSRWCVERQQRVLSNRLPDAICCHWYRRSVGLVQCPKLSTANPDERATIYTSLEAPLAAAGRLGIVATCDDPAASPGGPVEVFLFEWLNDKDEDTSQGKNLPGLDSELRDHESVGCRDDQDHAKQI